MNILIFGAGAVGSFFGGFLAKAGHRVSLLGRSWHMDVIRKNGLEITGEMGEYLIRDFTIYTNTKELRATSRSPLHGEYDIILLTVKPKDTEICAKDLAKIGDRKSQISKTPILSIQNGLGNLEILARYFPPSQLLAGRLITSVTIEPGMVKVGATADEFLVGEVSKKMGMMRAKEIAKRLTEAGIKSRAVKDIHKHLWSKMVFNTSLNGLASLLEVNYGDLLKSEETKEMVSNTVKEIYEVAKKKGIVLEPKTVKAHLNLLFNKLIPTFNSHIPSMLRAIQGGKKTDIDFLNGAFSRYGKDFGVKTPINDAITQLIKAKERLKQRFNG